MSWRADGLGKGINAESRRTGRGAEREGGESETRISRRGTNWAQLEIAPEAKKWSATSPSPIYQWRGDGLSGDQFEAISWLWIGGSARMRPA